MINIKRLDPKYILSNGRYWDYDHGEMFIMRPDEILAARKYFNNPNLAKDVILDDDKKKDYKDPIVSSNHSSPRSKKASKIVVKEYVDDNKIVNINNYRPFKLTKEQPYNNGDYKIAKPSFGIKFRRIVILGLTVYVAVSVFLMAKEFKSLADSANEDYANGEITVGEMVVEEAPSKEEVKEDISVEIRSYFNKYCKVFHLNEDKCFNKLYELTDGFKSDDFVFEYTCQDLSCKGYSVYANSYEELVVYFLRVLKQAPERYDLLKEDLIDNIEYQSEEDSYSLLIGDYCNLFDEDPCLIYAMIEAETSWDSDALLVDHNPCGLMYNNQLWKFDTYEEGLIETILQVKSYRYKGADTIEQIGAIHCPVDSDNDPNNLNKNWIDNVNKIYERIYDKQVDLFGKQYVSYETLGV